VIFEDPGTRHFLAAEFHFQRITRKFTEVQDFLGQDRCVERIKREHSVSTGDSWQAQRIDGNVKDVVLVPGAAIKCEQSEVA
jgi:hypothetical protein